MIYVIRCFVVFANCYSADDDYQEIEKCADEFQRLFEEEALPTIEDAVFPILFNDKDFLFRVNAKITEQIKGLFYSFRI